MFGSNSPRSPERDRGSTSKPRTSISKFNFQKAFSNSSAAMRQPSIIPLLTRFVKRLGCVYYKYHRAKSTAFLHRRTTLESLLYLSKHSSHRAIHVSQRTAKQTRNNIRESLDTNRFEQRVQPLKAHQSATCRLPRFTALIVATRPKPEPRAAKRGLSKTARVLSSTANLPTTPAIQLTLTTGTCRTMGRVGIEPTT
jgi:hypothetical protein